MERRKASRGEQTLVTLGAFAVLAVVATSQGELVSNRPPKSGGGGGAAVLVAREQEIGYLLEGAGELDWCCVGVATCGCDYPLFSLSPG